MRAARQNDIHQRVVGREGGSNARKYNVEIEVWVVAGRKKRNPKRYIIYIYLKKRDSTSRTASPLFGVSRRFWIDFNTVSNVTCGDQSPFCSYTFYSTKITDGWRESKQTPLLATSSECGSFVVAALSGCI